MRSVSPSVPDLGLAPGWPLIGSKRSSPRARGLLSASITQIPWCPGGRGQATWFMASVCPSDASAKMSLLSDRWLSVLPGGEPSDDVFLPAHAIPEKLKEGSGPVSFKERLVAVGWWARFSPQIWKWKPPFCCTQSSTLPNLNHFSTQYDKSERTASLLSRCPVSFSQPETLVLPEKGHFLEDETMKTTLSAWKIHRC